jgi:hypothetical protein
MGDRADTHIVISGMVTTSEAFAALASAAVSENAKPSWEEGVFMDDGSFYEHIQQALDEGTSLDIYGSDKLGGTMDDVEDVCRSHGLSYEVHGERGTGFDSFVKRWSPGWDEPMVQYGEGDPSIEASKVVQLLAKGKSGIEELMGVAQKSLGVGLPERLEASDELKLQLEHLIQVEFGEIEPSSSPSP